MADHLPPPKSEKALNNAVQYKDVRADENKIKLLVAGGLSGAMSRTVVAPLSRTTVLFQVQSMRKSGISDSYTRGIIPALRTTLEKEGFYGFFRGNGTHLVKKAPFAAIKFTSYERYKQLFTSSKHEEAKTSGRLMAGAAAAFTAVVLTYPLDLVQTTLAVQTSREKPKYSGIIGTLRKIAAEEGISQWYRGMAVTITSSVPYIALNMTLWETFKQFARKEFGYQAPWVSATCGALSGATASTITFPLDVLRRHMQLNSKSVGEVVYTGYWDAVRKIWLKNGIKGFYRGIVPHYLAVIPVTSISLGMYDLLKLILGVT